MGERWSIIPFVETAARARMAATLGWTFASWDVLLRHGFVPLRFSMSLRVVFAASSSDKDRCVRVSTEPRRRTITALTCALALLACGGLRASDFDVVISEIHYHPFGIHDPTGEFVELFNAGFEEVSLEGWEFSSGLQYRFGDVVLGARERIVVAKEPDQIDAGGARVFGPYSGRLDNGGETLELADADGVVIARVVFGDDFPWSQAADGHGPSLEQIGLVARGCPPGDHDRPQLWRSSRRWGGTPGRENSHAHDRTPFGGRDVAPVVWINEFAARADGYPTGFVEIATTSLDAIDIGGYRVVTETVGEGAIPAGTSVSAASPVAIAG